MLSDAGAGVLAAAAAEEVGCACLVELVLGCCSSTALEVVGRAIVEVTSLERVDAMKP